MKPTTKERLKMPTPDYFKRWAKILLSSGSVIAASGVATALIPVTLQSQLGGIPVPYFIEQACHIGGAAIAGIGLATTIWGPFLSNLVYDDKKHIK